MPGDADELRAGNARLRERIGQLRMLVEDKDAKIAALEERVARLERLISRNSGNSSMPPSTDDLPGRKPPERRPRRGGGRKPGKRPGSPGAYLAWNGRPDKTANVFPEGTCSCGTDLVGAADLGGAVLTPGHRPAGGAGGDHPVRPASFCMETSRKMEQKRARRTRNFQLAQSFQDLS